jgi:type IX secretion system PorP/SprF family membrane protein
MKKTLLVVHLVFCFLWSNAQQEAQYTQFMVNPFLYNPALSGCEDFFDLKTAYRTQWTGLEGAPRTFYLSVHSPISSHHMERAKKDHDDRRHSIGGLMSSDKAGDLIFNNAYLSYSYTITLSKGVFWGFNNHKRGVELALGTSAGVKQYRLDLTRIAENTQVESILLGNNKFLPDASLGAWLYFGDYTYVGLSAQQLLRNKLNTSNFSRLNQHYNLVAGTEFFVGDGLKILPSAMLKKVKGSPMSLDINARIDYQDTYFGGLSWRVKDAISVMIGTLLMDKYEIAYSYDFTYSKLKSYSGASHELILGFRINPSMSTRNAEDNWR